MRAKRLTRAQKQRLTAEGLLPDAYQLVRELGNSIIVEHKETGEIRIIGK